MSKLVDLQDWLQQNERVEKQESKLFLTEKELRSYPKYKNASDEEVQNAILTFHKLALVCYQAFCSEESAGDVKGGLKLLKNLHKTLIINKIV